MKQFIILIAALFLLSCQRNREVEQTLSSTEEMMQDQPKDALKMLRAIDPQTLSNRRLHAKYALLLSQALDKNYIDIANDSLISFAVDYYTKKGSNREKALAYYYQGRVYSNAGNVDSAIESFIISEDAATHTDEYYLLGQINYNIGKLYQQQYSLRDAIVRYGKAADYFQKTKSEQIWAQMLASQAVNHFVLDERDSAYFKLNKADEIYKNIHATHKIPEVREQIAAMRLDNNEDIQSIKQELRNCYDKYNFGEVPIASMGLWQSIYLKENRLDSARICGAKMLANRNFFSSSQIAGCLVRMEQIECALENYFKAYHYCSESNLIIDSMKINDQDQLIQGLEQKYKAKMLKQELSYLESRHAYQTIILILTIVLVGVGVVIASIILYRWRKRTQYELNCAKNEIERMSTTYSEMQTQLESLRANTDSNNDQEVRIFKAIEDRLKRLKELITEDNTGKPTKFIKKFQKYIEVDVNSRFALSDIQYVVNKKYFGIIDHLKATYPGLSKQDLDLCSLLCYGFSQYGICYMYQYSDIGSFYNKRSRLRKKLGLEQDGKIEDFIKETLKQLSQKGLD